MQTGHQDVNNIVMMRKPFYLICYWYYKARTNYEEQEDLPEEDVIQLDMSIEDAAKLVISAGLVYPENKLVSLLWHIYMKSISHST